MTFTLDANLKQAGGRHIYCRGCKAPVRDIESCKAEGLTHPRALYRPFRAFYTRLQNPVADATGS